MSFRDPFPKASRGESRSQIVLKKDENGAFVVVSINHPLDPTRRKNMEYNEEKDKIIGGSSDELED